MKNIFLLNILENNHRCAPVRFFITNINKVPTMLLEKVSVHTEILFVCCYNFFLLFAPFLCFLKIVYYCLKVYMNLLCSCVLYMYGFDFSFLSRCLLGTIFPQQTFCFGVHSFFSVTKM